RTPSRGKIYGKGAGGDNRPGEHTPWSQGPWPPGQQTDVRLGGDRGGLGELGLDEPAADRQEGGLGPVLHAQLLEDPGDVGFGGAGGTVEGGGDLLVAQSLGEKGQGFQLPGGQGRPGPCRPGHPGLEEGGDQVEGGGGVEVGLPPADGP